MSELSALNDLFTGEDEPEAAQRRGSALGVWIRSALGVAALTVVTVVLLRVGGVAVPLVALVAGWSAVLLLRRVAAGGPPPPVRGRRSDDDAYSDETEDGLRAAVKRWERRLGTPARFQQVTHSAVAELVDERLRQRHGCTRADDPQRARKMLGDRLWTFLDTPPRRQPAPKDYAALIAEVEKI